MNLRDALLAEHSKAQKNTIVEWIGTSQRRFDELFGLFLTDEYRVVQRAAWPLSYCVVVHPFFIKEHFKKMIDYLHQPGLPDAVKRNTLRLLQHVNIPAKYHGELMDLCIKYISSHTEPAAVKAFALTILQNLSQYYPEIKGEVKIIIEDRWDRETPAFRSRAKKFLKS